MTTPTELSEKLVRFVGEHSHEDIHDLLLKAERYPDIPIGRAVRQIEGRRIAKKKLPFWYEDEYVLYPPKQNLEQCTSQRAAEFKSLEFEGRVMFDLTGGFGVDSACFAQSFDAVHYVEPNRELFQVAAYNFRRFGMDNVHVHYMTAERFLQENPDLHADLIYVDPSRRGKDDERLTRLEDCSPDVLTMMPGLMQRTSSIVVKASPMLDIEQGVRQLGHVSRVIILSVGNEVKELLFELSDRATDEWRYECLELLEDGTSKGVGFPHWTESRAEATYGHPQRYLYEPHPSILKSGAFNLVSVNEHVDKLHPNSHLYTSGYLNEKFHGRVFEIEEVLRYNRRRLANFGKANIATRNFPLTVKQIRQQTGIREGGDLYLFATTNINGERIVVVCKKPVIQKGASSL